MKSRFLLITSMLFLFFLVVACNTRPASVDYHVGREGLVVTIDGDATTRPVYEDSAEYLRVKVENKGAFDVAYDTIALNVTADPFYVAPVVPADTFFYSIEAPSPTGDRSFLAGKQPGWPDGEWLEFVQPVTFKALMGLREEATTRLYASYCYPYETVLGTSLCVDANAFNNNLQRQVCTAETLSFSGGQGGPVAITSVENRPTPTSVDSLGGRGHYDIVQPQFILHVENVGDGRVLQPWPESWQEERKACALDVPKDLENAVRVNASLSNKELVCEPNPIFLRDGEAYTTCRLPTTEVGALSVANYLGAFRASLQYLYQESTSFDVTIQRRPGNEHPGGVQDDTFAERDELPGYVNGQERCSYCTSFPDRRNDAECKDWPSEASGTDVYSCACSADECRAKNSAKPGSCVYGSTWCPGSNYCCTTS